MEEQEKKPREFWFTLFRKGRGAAALAPGVGNCIFDEGNWKDLFYGYKENVYSPGRGYLCHQ